MRKGIAMLLKITRAGVLMTLLGTTAFAQEVRNVTLSTSGTALIGSEVTLSNGVGEIHVRRSDLDAVLKSLQPRDPLGGYIRAELPGPNSQSAAFEGSPVGPEDLAGTARILNALVGHEVDIRRLQDLRSGRILGVVSHICEEKPCEKVSILDQDGAIHQIEIDEFIVVRPRSDSVREGMTRVLDAMRQAGDRVPLRLVSTILDERDIHVGVIQRSQPWRTAWRAETTETGVEVTGWAIIENASGWDWKDVRLTLATGSVNTLNPDLYDPRDRVREVYAQPKMNMSLELDAMAESFSSRSMVASSPMRAPDPVIEDAQSFSRYTLPDPVNLESGGMILVPFVTKTIEGGREMRHRSGSGRSHPELVLRIENPLPLRLPGGVVTLYEDARGHAGDAMIPELAPGATEVVRFADDTAVTIREDRSQNSSEVRARISDGILTIDEVRVRVTTYTIQGADVGDRVLTLEHPRDPLISTEPMGEASGDYLVYRLDITQGEEVVFEVIDRQPVSRTIRVADVGDDMFQILVRSEIDAETRRMIEAISEVRKNIREDELRADRLEDDLDDLIAEQGRLVGLIRSLGMDSGANVSRRQRVDLIDAEIDKLRQNIREIQGRLDENRAALRDLVRQ